MLSGNGAATAHGSTPQSLEQLLERQWEQGSQFLMDQANHLDSECLFVDEIVDLWNCFMFSLYFSCWITVLFTPFAFGKYQIGGAYK